MRLITVEDVVKAGEAFVNEHRQDFLFGIGVEVLDRVVPGTAMLLLTEKMPSTFLGTVSYGAGVAFLKLAKRLEGRKPC